MSNARHSTGSAQLARLGFQDPDRAIDLIAAGPAARGINADVLAALADAADPDAALLSLTRIIDAADTAGLAEDFIQPLLTDETIQRGTAGVLGASQALADHLVRHPEDWYLLGPHSRISREDVIGNLLTAVGADPADDAPISTLAYDDALIELRLAYRRQLLAIARRDVVAAEDYSNTVADLSDAADAALAAALAISRSQVGPTSHECRLAVIAMGKCGARELNYVSDVDVIFVVESTTGDDAAAVRIGTELASGVMKACSTETAEGMLWEVDAGLRPEGKAGALVRTLPSHIGYYERWAETWEFQALLKARAAAGDVELGRRYEMETAPFVWEAAGRPNFVEDVQAMRRRVEDSLRGKAEQRQLKLGPGGLRDVEFSVQLLQMVHGREDPLVRSPGTLDALEVLSNYGYVGRADASGLARAYRFLRTLEHRLQLWRLRRVHVLPEDPDELRRVARSLGLRKNPVAEFDEAWRAEKLEVRRLHEKLFYRPLLQAVARLDPGEARLSPEQAVERLTALGFADPQAALGHLMALTSGVSRRAAIQRTLLPVLLEWFSDKPDPDMALLGFRRVSDALGSTPWYLRLLRDESVAAERLAELLGSSRYTAELLIRTPEAVALLSSRQNLAARDRAALESAALRAVNRREQSDAAMEALRSFRRRELLRISIGDVLQLADIEQVGNELSDLAGATLSGALQAAVLGVSDGDKLSIRFVVVGMGRLGGGEMSYASDADAMFVYDALPGVDAETAERQGKALASELRRLLALPSPYPELVLDIGLRPEGRNGPMVRSLDSYVSYYRKWSSPWEAQALLRARSVAGDNQLGAAFASAIDTLRYPQGGLSDDHLREMRRLKARMESERLPRGTDPSRHVKLGPGGLSDVEWTAQLLQLQYGYEYEQLRDTRTLPVLRAARDIGVIASEDEQILVEAWQLASRVRNAVMQATGRSADLLPQEERPLAIVAHLLGYSTGSARQLLEDYRRATRRSRKVMERVFYDS